MSGQTALVRLSRRRLTGIETERDTSFLGREDEMRRFESCVEAAVAGRGSFIAIAGTSGLGKTRLLEAFARYCGQHGVTAIRAGANAEASEPYAAWRQLVASLIASKKPTAALSSVYQLVLARLCEGGDPPPPPLPAEQTRYRIYDAVREFILACAGNSPLALLLDDIQWLDEPSLRLLRYLLPFIGEKPIVIAIAYDKQEPTWARLTCSPPATPQMLHREHVLLSGLAAIDMAEMPRWRKLATEPRGLLKRLHELTTGHPLHLEMIGELLLGRGGEGRDTGDSLFDYVAFSASSAERAVTSLARRLSLKAQSLLAACSVFPDSFTASEAAVLCATRERDAVSLLEGEASWFVQRVNRSTESYRFRHTLIRRVISESLDPTEQMLLQRRVAAQLSRSRRTRLSVWQLARWYHTSRLLPDAAEGVATCIAAAKAADEASAPEMKVVALRMALDLSRSAKLQARGSLLTDLGMAAAEAGAFREATESLWDAAATLKRNQRKSRQACDLLVKAASILHDSGAEESVWRPFQKGAYRYLRGRRDLRWARMRLLEPGRMQKISGPPLQVGRWIGLDRKAVRIARLRGNEADFCRTLLVYDWSTVQDIDALLARAQRWKSPLTRARALSVAAETLMYRHGEFDRACRLLEEQLTLHESRGSIVEQAKSLVRLTMAQLAAGELEAAVATRTRARDMVGRLGPGYLIYEHAGTTRGGDLYPEISMESNFAWYLEGNWEAVAEHWARAVALEELGGSPVHIVEAAMAAQAYARLGRFADARKHLDELSLVLGKLQPRDWAVNGAVGRASHAIWDMAGHEYAANYLELARKLIEAGVGDWTNTSLHLTVARMAALLGSASQAKDQFRKARLKLGRKRNDPRRAIIDYDEAVALRLLTGPDLERRSHLLQQATATFRARGMQGWVARAKAEAKRVPEAAL